MNILNNLGDIVLIITIIIVSLTFLILLILNLILIPFIPTNKKKLQKMIELAELKPTDIVYDLGSGDGRFIIAAARKGVEKAIGFEINPLLNFYAWLKSKIFKAKNVEFITENLWQADFSKCDVIFTYLLTSAMHKLEDKIIEEGKDGLRIVSNTFKFKNLKPEKFLEKEKIYLYILRK